MRGLLSKILWSWLSINLTLVQGEWSPMVYNGIKWTEANQGIATIAYTRSVGITRIPIAYHGGVDTNADGEISESNITQFANWVQDVIPEKYTGPLVMDYEQPWWNELRSKSITKERLNEILNVYAEGLVIAKKQRPLAQWGYWGLPGLRHTDPSWLNLGLDINQITNTSHALYPEIYDCNRGLDMNKRIQQHIQVSLSQAQGKIPVYVFVSPRYCGENGNRSLFVPHDVFIKRVNSALKAKWKNAKGEQFRIQGIILWDAYGYSERDEWAELDQKHVQYFQLLHSLVDAWTTNMKGINCSTGLPKNHASKYGLPEPQNSGDAIKNPQDKPIKDGQRVNNEAMPSNRTPSNRLPN